MFKRFSTNYMVFLFLVDIALVQLSLTLATRFRFILPFGPNLLPEWAPSFVYVPTPSLHIVVGVLWATSLLMGSVYTPRKVVFWFEEVQRLLLSHTIAALTLAGLLYLAKKELPRLTFVYFYVTAIILLAGYRVLLRSWYRLRKKSHNNDTRILVVGAGKVGCDLVERFRKQHWSSLEIVGFLDDNPQKQQQMIDGLPVLGRLDDAPQAVSQYRIDEVIIALPLHAHVRLANLVARLQQLPVHLHVVPDYFDLTFHAATIGSLGGIPMIGLRDPAIDGFQRFIKRLTDIVLSGVGLLVLSPLLAIIGIAIILEDNGPIFSRAERVGENGKLFHMFKFRSMVVNADRFQHLINQVDEQGHLIHKRADDPRVTHVGHFIRRTSIDELPQLINVLMGEMSLVGPRPELPWLVAAYEPWQRKRFAVPQGMTGWWQINGRSDNAMHLHTDQDLYYVQNYSWWLDLQILWRTLAVVFRGRGAY